MARAILATYMFASLVAVETHDWTSPSIQNAMEISKPYLLADGAVYLRAKTDFPVFKSDDNAICHAELIDESSLQEAEKFVQKQCSKGEARVIEKGDFVILIESQNDFASTLPRGKIPAPKKEKYITSDEPDKVKHGYSHNAYEVMDSTFSRWKASDSFLQDLRQIKLKNLYMAVFGSESEYRDWVSPKDDGIDDDFTVSRQEKVARIKVAVSQLNPSKPVIVRKSNLFFMNWQDALLYAAFVKSEKEIAKHFYVVKTAKGEALHLPENSHVTLKGYMTSDGKREDLNESQKYLCCEDTLLLISDENGKEYWITYSRLFGSKKKK